MPKDLTQDWLNWIYENIKRGCDRNELLDILLKEDFDLTQSKIALGFELSKANISANPLSKTGQYNTSKDHISASPIEYVSAEIYEVRDFLSTEECQFLIDQIKSTLRPSTIATSGEYDHSYRTSSTCDLGNIKCPLLMKLIDEYVILSGLILPMEKRCKVSIIWRVRNLKNILITLKEVSYWNMIMGERTYTFMIYLNDVNKGGTTEFHRLQNL